MAAPGRIGLPQPGQEGPDWALKPSASNRSDRSLPPTAGAAGLAAGFGAGFAAAGFPGSGPEPSQRVVWRLELLRRVLIAPEQAHRQRRAL